MGSIPDSFVKPIVICIALGIIVYGLISAGFGLIGFGAIALYISLFVLALVCVMHPGDEKI
jgi:hypothetical protein